MPRRPRNYLPGYCYHLVQRGTNRAQTFFDPDDCQLYLSLWRQYAALYELQVHAYCLMPNHVHFLVTPGFADSISKATREIGSTYASYVNDKYARTGTLWEGRHRSSLVDSDRYLLTCYRYIEMNPVRANIVNHPSQYRWSSYAMNAGADNGWLTPHPTYLGLGISDAERKRGYRELLSLPLGNKQMSQIRKAVNACVPLAGREFVSALQKKHHIDFGSARRGRPPGGRLAIDQK